MTILLNIHFVFSFLLLTIFICMMLFLHIIYNSSHDRGGLILILTKNNNFGPFQKSCNFVLLKKQSAFLLIHTDALHRIKWIEEKTQMAVIDWIYIFVFSFVWHIESLQLRLFDVCNLFHSIHELHDILLLITE